MAPCSYATSECILRGHVHRCREERGLGREGEGGGEEERESESDRAIAIGIGRGKGRGKGRGRKRRGSEGEAKEESETGEGGEGKRGKGGGSWSSRGSSVDDSCPPTRLKSAPVSPPVPTFHHHPLTAGDTAYRFARPPTAETTRDWHGEGLGGAAVWEEGRSLSDPWSGGGGGREPVHTGSSLPQGPVGSSNCYY